VDQTYLLLLGLAILIALGAGALIRNRILADRAAALPTDSPFAVSTEGDKICPKCGMGNLWTERSCSACGGPLKG
jgi:hypothetical protein